MPQPAPLPEPLSRGPFTVARAVSLGVTRSRLRSSDLTAPYRGVRTPQSLGQLRDLALAFAVRMSPDQYFSHTTAALLHGMRLPERFAESVLHVTSTAPTRAPRVQGVRGYQGGPDVSPVTLGQLRLTGPVETWCQLATLLSLDDLIAMGDGLVCREHPASTMDELTAAVAARRGMRGATRLRAALAHVRAGTDSTRETRLRLEIVRDGMPEPEVNGVILNRYGAEIAHGDLIFRRFRTVVEYDGGHHRTDERQYNIDIERLDAIMEENWRVIRVNKSVMARKAMMLGKIRTALLAAGWDGRAS